MFRISSALGGRLVRSYTATRAVKPPPFISTAKESSDCATRAFLSTSSAPNQLQAALAAHGEERLSDRRHTEVVVPRLSISDASPIAVGTVLPASPPGGSTLNGATSSSMACTTPVLDFNLQDRTEGTSPAKTNRVIMADDTSKDAYWKKIPLWKDVSEDQFLDYQWQCDNTVSGKARLLKFLTSALPEKIHRQFSGPLEHIRTREDFIQDVFEGISMAPMAIRLSPHTLSVIDWTRALEDPVRRQFLPMKSSALPDHRMLTLDSLNEKDDSPVKGLVHRYSDKALFLATSICPVYCRFCTRSYAVGGPTDTVTKDTLRPVKRRWEEMFRYIEETPTLYDIVVSGGDSYMLSPSQIYEIGERLISIPHIRRFRFASKGLAVCPSRILDPKDDWANALIEVSKLGRSQGKAVALHTHFNHPHEITWITALAARKFFEEGVTVRNQSVLLRGVNDDHATMSSLIRDLADINIQPYYVYQGDMVQGVEDLRTPLQTCLDLETQIRGSIAGFMMPQFVVDLPGGGGKRLAASYETYDRKTGISTFMAPSVTRGKDKVDKVYEYHDPDWCLEV